MALKGLLHGKVAARFAAQLLSFVEEHGLGEVYAAETGFLLARNPDTVRAPDVAFVKADRLRALQLPPTGYFPGAPDLAVEVVSPSDSYSEVQEKLFEWLEAGALAVVIVDPRKRVTTLWRLHAETLHLPEAETLRLPDLLPGWSLRLAELFR